MLCDETTSHELTSAKADKSSSLYCSPPVSSFYLGHGRYVITARVSSFLENVLCRDCSSGYTSYGFLASDLFGIDRGSVR